MERIPILRMGRFLLVTIQVDMQDQTALQLQEDLATNIQRFGAQGVMICTMTCAQSSGVITGAGE